MKKGFSLLVLGVVVLVLLIIVTATTIGVTNAQRNVKVLNFATELSILQDKVNLYYKKNNKYPLTETETSINITVSDNLSQYVGETIENGATTLYYLELEKIYDSNGSLTDELHSLNYGLQKNEEDVYLVSKETGRVYYKDGVEGYFTLTNELKEKIGYVEENKDNTVIIGNVSFKKSVDDYTNSPITTTIKVPKTYENILCKVYSDTLNGSEILTFDVQGEYRIYTTSSTMNSNYYIVVSYTDNGKTNSVTYTVDNFDNVVPNVEIVGSKKQIKNNLTNEIETFYQLDYSDNSSGIDEIKYAETKVEADVNTETNNLNLIREYMKVYGIAVNNNVLKISNDARWLTIYVKDKAGNEKYIYKQVPQIEKNAGADIESSVVETNIDQNDPHDLVLEP